MIESTDKLLICALQCILRVDTVESASIDKSKEILKELTQKALNACDNLEQLCQTDEQKEACTFLRELADFLLERNY